MASDDLIEAAKYRVKNAAQGDHESSMEIIRQAAIGIDILTGGDQIDKARLISLRFVGDALKSVMQGVPPGKALGIESYIAGAKSKDTIDRDFVLFHQVGRELGRLQLAGAMQPIEKAISAVARRRSEKVPTVRKAWNRFGAKKGWSAVQEVANEESE